MTEKNIHKKSDKNKLSKLHIALIASGCALVVLLVTLSCFALSYDKIFSGISVCEIEVGGLSSEDAMLLLEENFAERSPEIEVDFGDKTVWLYFSEFGEYDFETTAKSAFDYGKSNLFTKVFAYSTPFVNRKLPMAYYIDEEALADYLQGEYSESGATYTDTSYEITGDKLIITAGHSGDALDTEEIISKIKDAVSDAVDVKISAQIVHKNYEGVNISAIHKEISGSPENAYYDKENKKIIPHKPGYDFDVKSAEQLTLNLSEGESAEINLIVKEPEITEEKLTATMFKDVIATYTTKYNQSEIDRTHNLSLAAEKVNGTVLAPGQEFSYNNIVGERTVAKGYRNAKVFENGRVVDGLAGGICQVSTTIYNAALYGNMDIVERSNHSFPVSYAPMGQDATVVMDVLDFRFKNPYDNPVKITCTVSGGKCTTTILGIKEKDFTVEIDNQITATKPRDVEYQQDDALKFGEEKVIQSGSDGYTIKSTRIVYENGSVVKTEKLPSSYYIPLEKIVARNENATAPEPEDIPVNTTVETEIVAETESLPPELGLETEIY